MVFALLMRLRQAVLHPSLLLKRIAQNLAESKGKQKTDDEKVAEASEKNIQSLVEQYGGASREEIINILSQTAEPSLLGCCVCFEVSLGCLLHSCARAMLTPTVRCSQWKRLSSCPASTTRAKTA